MNMHGGHDVVTGGSGFIGRHLVRALLASGRGVTIIDRRSPGDFASRDGCRWVRGDVRERPLLNEVFSRRKVDNLYHLAAMTGVRTTAEQTEELYDINVAGTLSVARAADEHGVDHVIFASSSSVYGDAEIYPTPETAPLRPLSPYGASKARAEEILENSGGREGGTSFTSARLFTVFGPGGRPGMVIPTFVRHALERRPLPMIGSPESFRDFTNIRDAVRGLIDIAGGIHRGVPVNIASGRTVRLLDLAGAIERVVGFPVSIEHRPRHKFDVFGTHADISRARAWGYRPRVRLYEGLQEIVSCQLSKSERTERKSSDGEPSMEKERE